MALHLGFIFPRQPKSGVWLSLTPKDTRFGGELQRANDNGAGAPDLGTLVTLFAWNDFLSSSVTGTIEPTLYFDSLPTDNVKRFYRARHIRANYTDGDWTPWTIGVKPVSSDGSTGPGGPNIHPPAPNDNPYPTEGDIWRKLPVMLDGGVTGASGTSEESLALATSGDFTVDPEFDLWNSTAQPLGWKVDSGDSSFATRDDVVFYSGTASAKYTFSAGGAFNTWRGFTAFDPIMGPFCASLRPGMNYRVQIATRVSDNGGPPKVRVKMVYNVAESNTATVEFFYGAGITWQVNEAIFAVPTNAEARSKIMVEFQRGNTTAHDFWLDSIHIEEHGVASVVAGQATGPSIQDVTIPKEKIGPTMAIDMASRTSRSRFINGGAQDKLSYWHTEPAGLVSTESGGDVYKGSYSLKVAHSGGGIQDLYQSTDPRETGSTGSTINRMLFAVRPSRRIQVDFSTKVSGASIASACIINEYSATGAFITSTQAGPTNTATVWTDYSVEHTVGPTTFFIAILFRASGAATGSVWWDELYFTDLIPINDTVLGYFDNGLKSSGFTIDWLQGGVQFVEINGTSLAITMINPEAGARYILFLKQNSQPDTVTWPTNVFWEDSVTPTLSTTTGRIDRFELIYTGVKYYAQMVSFWFGDIELLMSGIPSAQAFGTPIVDRPHVDPSGIASAQAFGTAEVEVLLPSITSSFANHQAGGNVCNADPNATIRVNWTVANAPDGAYHITIDGVGGTTEPSVGFKDITVAFSENLTNPPFTEAAFFGPYVIRLKRDSDSGEVDNDTTNTVQIDYSQEFCS